jgi:CpeT protein
MRDLRCLRCVVLAGVCLLTWRALHAEPVSPPTSQPTTQAVASLDLLKQVLTGHFSSAKQAAVDPDYMDIHLQCVEIWKDRHDGPWLYIEQARGDLLAAPYRQRVYRLSVEPDGTFASAVYELPGKAMDVVRQYAGAHKDPTKLKDLTPQQLVKKEGCTVYLTFKAGTFEGGTREKGCPSRLAGATYATSEVVADQAGLRTWDRGYDAQDQQVWGAEKGPYQFDRLADEPAMP